MADPVWIDYCAGCGRPIRPTQERWTAREPRETWHLHCVKPARPTDQSDHPFYRNGLAEEA